jgi:hypothetical protein
MDSGHGTQLQLVSSDHATEWPREEVLANFPKIGFLGNCIYSLDEQDNIKTNTALVQSLVKQSATWPCEAPSSGTDKEES